jgi:hypothetical protein
MDREKEKIRAAPDYPIRCTNCGLVMDLLRTSPMPKTCPGCFATGDSVFRIVYDEVRSRPP